MKRYERAAYPVLIMLAAVGLYQLAKFLLGMVGVHIP